MFAEKTAIALVRRPEGSPDIFATMVVDVLRTFEAAAANMSSDVKEAFLERVREWQAFIARTHRPLSPDAQIGLLGELWMLRLFVDTPPGGGAKPGHMLGARRHGTRAQRVEPTLRREPKHKGAAAGEGSYSTELIGCIDLVS